MEFNEEWSPYLLCIVTTVILSPFYYNFLFIVRVVVYYFPFGGYTLLPLLCLRFSCNVHGFAWYRF